MELFRLADRNGGRAEVGEVGLEITSAEEESRVGLILFEMIEE
jgi:hypothetical protein